MILQRSKGNLDEIEQLVYENYFDEIHTNENNSELDNYADYNYTYYEYDYTENKTENFPEALTNKNAISKFCNYFDAPQKWKNFLVFNFVFLYIFPVLMMIITYGLIIKKVNKNLYLSIHKLKHKVI